MSDSEHPTPHAGTWESPGQIAAAELPEPPTHCDEVLGRGTIRDDHRRISYLYARHGTELLEQERIYRFDELHHINEQTLYRPAHHAAARRAFGARRRQYREQRTDPPQPAETARSLVSVLVGWFR